MPIRFPHPELYNLAAGFIMRQFKSSQPQSRAENSLGLRSTFPPEIVKYRLDLTAVSCRVMVTICSKCPPFKRCIPRGIWNVKNPPLKLQQQIMDPNFHFVVSIALAPPEVTLDMEAQQKKIKNEDLDGAYLPKRKFETFDYIILEHPNGYIWLVVV
ncbi:uncharacterized protein [Rutidosis leptorrhynchoides]|uniref:uncharacterized protein n=1 Tax=Rutidosis leptorrhynchoides TaxID=125765 RepID=UPI003A9A254B